MRSIVERRVLGDASAFFAVLDAHEPRHADAVAIVLRLRREARPLVTTDLVVAETHALALRRLGRRAAQTWLDEINVPIVFLTPVIYDGARELLRRYGDKDFTLADAVSFVVMEALGIREAFTFDDHFRQYGLEVLAP